MPPRPVPSFNRSELNPNAGRLVGAGIPVTNRNFWYLVTGTSGAAGGSSYFSYGNDVTNGKGSYLARHYLAYDASNLRLVYANTSQDPGAAGTSGAEAFTGAWANSDLGTTITVQAKVRFPQGSGGSVQEIPVTFGGKQQVTIDEGGVVVSDPVGAPLFLKSVQAYVDIVTFVQATTSTYWPLFKTCFGGDSEGYLTNTNLGVVGSGVSGLASFGSQMFSPLLVLGQTNPRNQVVVGCCGDSIISGGKNRTKDGALQGVSVTTDDFSFIDYALGYRAPKYPLVKFSHGGILAQAEAGLLSTANAFRFGVRHGMAELCTHTFVLLGTNDINNGVSAANVQTALTAVYNWLRQCGSKIVAITIPPRTTSSDSWATAANQTVLATESVRVAVNGWIRNTLSGLTSTYGGPLVDYIWDLCATCEVNSSNVLTQNGGLWLTTGVAQHYTADGIHPSFDGNQNLLNNDPALTAIINGFSV